MSLKLRITAWFTFMIFILTALVVSIVFVVADESLADDPTEELIKTVSRNASAIIEKGGKGKEFASYRNGVYCQLLDNEGVCLLGVMPEDVMFDEPFENGKVFNYIMGDVEYYIYDMKVEENMWLRGCISAEEPSETTEIIIVSVSIILPCVLILSVLGGWVIAKKSLKCIDVLVDTTESINSGEDLSARVKLVNPPIEIRRMGEELNKMFSRLERSFESEKQFSSDVSHELKTPVTVAVSECHRLKKSIISEEGFSSLNVLEKQLARMKNIIESLLKINQLQQKTEKFTLVYDDISAFLELYCEDYALDNSISVNEKSDGKSVSLKIEKGVYVRYNPDLMARIIFNLLDNSRKYTSSNGKIIVELKATDEGATIVFKDDGVGISVDDLHKIWNRFWQADSSRGVDKGVGLGLAMVKEAVEFQGGSIFVESEKGKGTSFTINLIK